MISNILVEWPIQILGTLALILLILYAILAFYFFYKKQQLKKAKAKLSIEAMPVLRPIPIPTASLSGLEQVLAFVFLIRRWRLETAFRFKFAEQELLIPAGFEFDGASIPRPLWALLSPTGLLLIPGLIHDFGYRYNAIYIKNQEGEVVLGLTESNRFDWDKLFLEIGNQVNGVELLNKLAKLGLAIGGHTRWDAWRSDNLKVPKFRWTLDECQTGVGDEKVIAINSTTDDEPNKPDVTDAPTAHSEIGSSDSTNYRSGKTKTTTIGYKNVNNQKVLGTRDITGGDHKQHSYKIECLNCGNTYGAKGPEIYRRKCPQCQQGKSGSEF